MMDNRWNAVRLADYCSKIGSGATPRGGETVYLESGISFIRSQNVYNGYFDSDGLAFLDEDHAEQLKGVAVEPGDILLNITGDSVARSCRAPDGLLPARVNQHVAIIRPRSEDFDSRFVSYFFISPFMQDTMLSLAGSGGTRKALTKEMIERFEIPKPSLPVQESIADTLSAYDDLIENNQRRMTLLEESARQLYREWLVRLRFPGHEHTRIINGVPEGWERVPLEDALVLQRGFDLPTQDRQEGNVPIYGSTGIVGYHDKAKASAPGVVTGRSGTLGEVQYVADDYWPLNTALWVKEFKRVTPLFALFLLREMDLKQYNGGASVPTLDRKSVHKIEITVPSNMLLSAFDEFATDVFAQIKNLNVQNQKLRAARDLLLPRLMSGEIAV
ncbi:MAG: restriction endonuclease subunit S [Gallionella sp.]|nr:restriction endonuclease subunit S [Gallionella sp.]